MVTASPTAQLELRAWLEAHRDDLTAYLVSLVQIPSDNPPGNCSAIADRVDAEFKRFGLETERYDVPRQVGFPAPTVLGWLGARTTAPAILLNAHADVIAPGEGWTVDTGNVLAVMSAGHLTAMRTAAASAVATRSLARPSSSTLAIVGAGVQAVGHLWAMTAVRPIERVRVVACSQASAERFIGKVSGRYPGLEVTALRTPEEAIRDADIVCTVSSATEPVTRLEWLKPGVHINGVGSHSPNAREIDGETMRAGRVVVDSREANLKECGDCMIPISEGYFGDKHVSDEIGEVLLGTKPGRSDDDGITIYQSCGLALQDVATAKLVYEKALERNIGVEVPL